jgi:hypothetical protein
MKGVRRAQKHFCFCRRRREGGGEPRAGAHRQRLISWRSEEKMEGSRPDSSACSSARACEMSVACGSMVC